MNNKEKGAALLTVVILGLVALAVIAALMSFLMYGKKTSIMERKYTSALEAAKGASDYIMKGLVDVSLICTTGTGVTCNCDNLLPSPNLKCPSCSSPTCPKADKISLGSFSTIGNYNLNAQILSKVETPNETIYGIRVTATNPNSQEKAEIEFVFKLQ